MKNFTLEELSEIGHHAWALSDLADDIHESMVKRNEHGAVSALFQSTWNRLKAIIEPLPIEEKPDLTHHVSEVAARQAEIRDVKHEMD